MGEQDEEIGEKEGSEKIVWWGPKYEEEDDEEPDMVNPMKWWHDDDNEEEQDKSSNQEIRGNDQNGLGQDGLRLDPPKKRPGRQKTKGDMG